MFAMSRRAVVSANALTAALVVTAVLTLPSRVGAADYVWIEGESLAQPPAGFKVAGWGNKHYLSGGNWLFASIDGKEAAEEVDRDSPHAKQASFFLSGPGKDVRQLDDEAVAAGPLGKVACQREAGRIADPFGDVKDPLWNRYTVWRNPAAPFGAVKLRIERNSKLGMKEFLFRMELTLTGAGKDARSGATSNALCASRRRGGRGQHRWSHRRRRQDGGRRARGEWLVG